jgi:hypothetical protein
MSILFIFCRYKHYNKLKLFDEFDVNNICKGEKKEVRKKLIFVFLKTTKDKKVCQFNWSAETVS